MVLYYLTNVGNLLSKEEADELLKDASDDIDLSTNVGPLHLSIPIISANMDTITGPKMFNVMKEAGGWGWLHRFEEEDVRLQWALNGLPITPAPPSSKQRARKEGACKRPPDH